jgi:transcriptional regulator with XRE-family HTH domain
MVEKVNHATDVHVGAKIRLRRQMLFLTQTAVAEALGVTFQQIQKYEKGTNRVAPSRLQVLSRLLSVPVSFFFEEGSNAALPSDGKPPAEYMQFLSNKEAIALNRGFAIIEDKTVRRTIIALVDALAEAYGEADSIISKGV